jgi:hypothetical protein
MAAQEPASSTPVGVSGLSLERRMGWLANGTPINRDTSRISKVRGAGANKSVKGEVVNAMSRNAKVPQCKGQSVQVGRLRPNIRRPSTHCLVA